MAALIGWFEDLHTNSHEPALDSSPNSVDGPNKRITAISRRGGEGAKGILPVGHQKKTNEPKEADLSPSPWALT